MNEHYDCYRQSDQPPAVVRGFINNASSRPASADTEVSLSWIGCELLIQARCRCNGEVLTPSDRFVVAFDASGREADLITISITPDGTFNCTQLGTSFFNTDPTWAAEAYPFPARVETRLLNDGWQVEVYLPLVNMFSLRGGRVPDSFRLNIARIFAGREWSYWPLSDGIWAEYAFAFPTIDLIDEPAPSRLAVVPVASDAIETRLPELSFCALMYDTSRGAIGYNAESYARFVDFLAACGHRSFMLYFEDGFRYESHPEFASPNALCAADIEVIERACQRNQMELILAQTTFGHMYDVLRHPAYIHLAEDGNPYQICPLHPETRPFLSDLLDEIIPLSKSAYFNVNCDESRFLGRCPRCRQKGADAAGKENIFLDHLLWLHEKVSAHGRRMMIWGDHLLGMPSILEKLPKDTVIMDWHYVNWAAYPSLTFFQDQGFEVIGSPSALYSSLRNFTTDCIHRGAKGMLHTVWESRNLLGFHCPGAYFSAQIASGHAGQSDTEIMTGFEKLVWPEEQPGVSWLPLYSWGTGLDDKLAAKARRDAATAISRCQAAEPYGWVAEQLLHDLTKS